MSLLNYAEPITEGLLLLDFTRIFLVSEYLLICKEVLESISEPLSKEWPKRCQWPVSEFRETLILLDVL